ncbi:RING finger and WD repeat domain-containing protein 3 [Actinomortierella wolfii]|nr:RING finger and WD repeat domain-containing protein 3 [Actinomortierella wolfii]
MSQRSNGQGDVIGQDGNNERQNSPLGSTGGRENIAASQEADFQQTGRVNMPQRTAPARQTIPDPVPSNDETEESTCSICYESWTNSGPHRLVSIKCGHLFGESCIVKWIQQQLSRSNRAKCPSCNASTKRSDIRRLWSKSVTVLDTAERDEALKKAKKEAELRIAREQELVQSRLAYEMLKGEMSQLKRRYDHVRALKRRYKSTIKRMRLSDPAMDALARRVHYEYKPAHVVRLTTKQDAYQHMSYRPSEEVLVCSRALENGSHGIFKISMRDYTTSMYFPLAVHSRPIKDVQCYIAGKGLSPYDNKALVLTTSLDKTLKLSSVASQSVVMTYNMQAAGWSCCWSSSDPYTMYAAVKSSESAIMVYDIRSTKGHVAKYTHPDLLGPSPIHTLCHVGSLGGQKGRAGLVCGNLEGVVVLDLEQLSRFHENGSQVERNASTSFSRTMTSSASCSQQSNSSQALSQELTDRADWSRGSPSMYRLKESSCWSVSYDHDSELWMGSFRFKDPHRPTEHIVGTIVPNNEYDTPEDSRWLWKLEPRTSFEGGQPLRGFGRSCVTTRQDGSVHAIAGSHNEIVVYTETQEPTMTSNSNRSANFASRPYTNRVVLKLRGEQAINQRQQQGSSSQSGTAVDSSLFIKDVKGITVGQSEYLCSLSDKEVRLFRWSGQSLMPNDDDDDDDDGEDSDYENLEQARGNKETSMRQDDRLHRLPQRRGAEEDGGQDRIPLLNVEAAGARRQEDRRQAQHEQGRQQHEVIVLDGDDATEESNGEESSTQASETDEAEDEEEEEDEDDPEEYYEEWNGFDDPYDYDTWLDIVYEQMANDAYYYY